MATAMMAGSLAGPRPAVLAGSSRTAFRGQVLALRPQRMGCKHSQRVGVQRVEAYVREYPDPEFIDEVLDSFPEKMVANVEEARVLFSEGGYVYLDVRPTLELEEVGKVKGCVNVPLVLSTRKYDPEQNKKVVFKEDNPDFVAQIKKRFPDPETPLLVACSDGKAYSLDALEILDEEGYSNIVGLKGGFYAWFRTWDNNLRRRRGDNYTEAYTHGGDSTGIHGTGAGFERMDKIEHWVPPTY